MESNGPSVDASLARLIEPIRLLALDFDGVFTDNTVYVLQDGTEAVRCWRSDGLGLAKLAKFDVQSIVISTETNPVVTARCNKLRLRCIQGCHDKLQALGSLMGNLGLEPHQVAFMGNDINDEACLRHVGLPIVVSDAHPSVVDLAAYRTAARGGRGAVREVCDLLEMVLAKRKES